jgi:hypothetical protein
MPAGDPIDDQAAVFVCLLPGEVAGIEGMDLTPVADPEVRGARRNLVQYGQWRCRGSVSEQAVLGGLVDEYRQAA